MSASQQPQIVGFASEVVRLFSKMHGGTIKFVQVGANDGQLLDPISPHIDRKRWSGLVIEPVPQYFRQLKRRYSDFPNVAALQCAIGRNEGQRTMFYVDESVIEEHNVNGGPIWLKGIASFSSRHLLRHGVVKKGIKKISVSVQTGRQVLERNFPGAVDLLVVDVEGAEREVLESFNICALQPSCIIFESQHLGYEDREVIENLLRDGGYVVIWARPDAVAVNAESKLGKALIRFNVGLSLRAE